MGHNITFYKVSDDSIRDCPDDPRRPVSIDTYLKLLIPDYINNVDKIIYFDSDVIISDSIDDLWNTDLAHHIVGASIGAAPLYRRRNLGLSDDDPYYNTGVIVFDCAKWKKERIGEKCFDYMRQNVAVLERMEQDVMNAVLRGFWKTVPIRFNAMLPLFDDPQKHVGYLKQFDLSEIEEARYSPAVIHYTGNYDWKPWYSNSRSTRKGDYLKYLKGSPYEGIELREYRKV